MTVPGIGKAMAAKLHDTLGLESLEDLEAAAHDGRLESLAEFGRLAGRRIVRGREAECEAPYASIPGHPPPGHAL
jgi:hypothetical protein